MSMLRARLERLKGIKPSQAAAEQEEHASSAGATESEGVARKAAALAEAAADSRQPACIGADANIASEDEKETADVLAASSIEAIALTEAAANTELAGPAAVDTPTQASNAASSSKTSHLLKLTSLSSDEAYAHKWDALQIQLAEHEYGTFLMRTCCYKSDEAIGMHVFGEWRQAGLHLNAFYPEYEAELEQFLFLDLETTGLGSGTGNIPFMVGLAFWKNEQLIVEQALIRHPAEERAMLAYLHQLTAHFTHLVTYNGKSFDWPLLQSRYLLNGMRETIWQPLHIDLLHPSRALWRNTLESCKLSHIEKMRLGIVRVDDLPGSEAPARYFQFLASGDPEELADVFKHNEIDMLSLVTLAIRFGHLLSNEDVRTIVQQPCEPEELVRTGLWLEKMERFQYSKQLFQLAIHIPQQNSQTLMMLAMRDKKRNELERALMLWERIVAASETLVTRTHIEAAVELSMYYEHKAKQPEQALHYATLAYELQLQLQSITKRDAKQKEKELSELNKRLERIKKKCSLSV